LISRGVRATQGQDTREHDWLEGRGEKRYRIALIDDATSRLLARFVRHATTEENRKLLWLLGEVGTAAGILYGPGEPVSDGGETQTG